MEGCDYSVMELSIITDAQLWIFFYKRFIGGHFIHHSHMLDSHNNGTVTEMHDGFTNQYLECESLWLFLIIPLWNFPLSQLPTYGILLLHIDNLGI